MSRAFKFKILVVDDDDLIRITLVDDLVDAGFDVSSCAHPDDARVLIRDQRFDVVVTDMRISGDRDGLDMIEFVKKTDPETSVIVMTAYGSVENAVQALKSGADDYLTKPFESEELVLLLKRAQELSSLKRENWQLRAKLGEQQKFDKIVAISGSMQEVIKKLAIVAPTDETVLLSGESGTGKEIVARSIHENSSRREGPFVPVSCAALPHELLESELFGHEKGAFTGATQRKIGRFERAIGGTLFLDEVDDTPMDLQVKLLRVLQEREFERVGGAVVIHADARVIAATKVDLSAKVKDGSFREDLYYRLSVIPINLPPLRARRDDISLLLHHFLSLACPTCEKVAIAPDAVEYLEKYSWPGNVRELKNVVSRLVVLGQCEKITLPLVQSVMGTTSAPGESCLEPKSLEDAVADLERGMIEDALNKSHGNKSKAAASLGLKQSTFRDKVRKYFPKSE